MRAVDLFGFGLAAVITLLSPLLTVWSPIWWVAIGFAALITVSTGLHILWNNLSEAVRAAIRPMIWKPTGYLRAWIGFLLLFILLGGGYVGSHWHPTKGLDQGELPKQSENFWVTTKEIETQRNAGRVLLTLSPGELANMYVLQGAESVAPYKDSWVKIDYPFYLLMHDPTGPDSTVLRISGTSSAFVVAYFPLSMHAKLLQLRPGDRVRAICQLNRIDQAFFAYTFATRLFASACEAI
jgi:hypothetical protein